MTSESILCQTDMLRQLKKTPRLLDLVCTEKAAELSIQQSLRKDFPAPLVQAACSLQELRQRAKRKFSRAESMWFDRVGLEQATSETVALHKSKRFSGHVWDFCSGIGGDAVALGRQCDVIAVDSSSARCLMTRWNAEAYGVADRVHIVNADVHDLTDRSGWVSVDPDRRALGLGAVRQGRSMRDRPRRASVEDYVPSYDFLLRLATEFRGGAIKLGPASDFLGKFPEAEIEIISLGRECKEATVWFGELSGTSPFRATVLPSGESFCGNPAEAVQRVAAPGSFLYDPDPALVRSGLVDLLAEHLGLWRLDDTDEYLASDTLVTSPFFQSFAVRDVLRNNNRAIREAFRGFGYGQCEIKCRSVRVNPESVRRKLPLAGTEAGVLVFARIRGTAHAIVCERVNSPSANS